MNKRLCRCCKAELPPLHEGRGKQKQFCGDNCRVKLGYRRKHGVTTNRQRLERQKQYVGLLQLSEPEKAWLAAIIDGEGWIGIVKGRRYRKQVECWSYSPVVAVMNTNVLLTNKVVELVGKARTRTQQRDLGGNFKPIRHVFVERLYIADALKAAMPYLIAKRRQAEIVMNFCETHDKLPVRTSPLDSFETMWLECKALNKRGR